MEEKLRKDFPIDWDEDQYVSRREFLKFMTLASGGLAAGSAALAVWSRYAREERIFAPALIASSAEIPVGGSREFGFPRPQDPCVLLQPKPGVFVAYSRRCTHLSCPVEYQQEEGRLYCPCHNGAFSAEDGSVIQGPPPRPLDKIMLELRGGEIYAVGVRRS